MTISEKIKVTQKQWFKLTDQREKFKNLIEYAEFESNWTKKEFYIKVYYDPEYKNNYVLFRLMYKI